MQSIICFWRHPVSLHSAEDLFLQASLRSSKREAQRQPCPPTNVHNSRIAMHFRKSWNLIMSFSFKVWEEYLKSKSYQSRKAFLKGHYKRSSQNSGSSEDIKVKNCPGNLTTLWSSYFKCRLSATLNYACLWKSSEKWKDTVVRTRAFSHTEFKTEHNILNKSALGFWEFLFKTKKIVLFSICPHALIFVWCCSFKYSSSQKSIV